jgi:hypothetical protein
MSLHSEKLVSKVAFTFNFVPLRHVARGQRAAGERIQADFLGAPVFHVRLQRPQGVHPGGAWHGAAAQHPVVWAGREVSGEEFYVYDDNGRYERKGERVVRAR